MMKLVRYIMPAIVVITLLAALPATTMANPGLRVENAILVADVSPGDTITHKMTLSLVETDSPMDLTVEVNDIDNVKSTYSARDFVSVDKISFHLEPGEPQDVTATVHIPSDVGDGGRYAVINLRQKPTGTGVAPVVAVNVRLYLTIKDSQFIHEGEITEVSAGEAISGKPVNIFITFKNTGNHHFKFKAEVTVSNAQGEVLDTIYTALSPSPVIPSMSKEIKVSFIPKTKLDVGVYSIKSKIMLEDGTVLDTGSATFELTETYLPPPSLASVTLTPGYASVLETKNGGISISFPKGAVIGEVEVSLISYPAEQLPGPPANFNLATTCFRIDGLTGLLLKEATVTVKYTPADLEKAEGDASRLTLARWDEANNQWSVLKTKVDKEANTLSTKTNQLSIWAVMVAPPAGVNWPLIGGIIGGVIVVGLGVFFWVRKRRVA